MPPTRNSNGNSVEVKVQCCSTFTETTLTIRDGELTTATSTFTQLLSSVWVFLFLMFLNVHRDQKDYYRRGVQDGHLDFHTAPEL